MGSYDGDAHMNQGYHDPEVGVDWDDEDGDGTCCGVGRNVYFNAWLYRDAATTQTTLWITYYQSNTSNCTRFRARLYEYTDLSRIIGHMNYRHAYVDNPQPAHGCSANSGGIACRNTVGQIQTTTQRNQSGDTCGWTGPHLHSGHATSVWGDWSSNVGSPPGGIPANGGGPWTYHNPGYEGAVTERSVQWCNPAGTC